MSDQNEAEKCGECNGEGYNDIGSNRVACSACACTGLANPAAYIAQLRTDAQTLAKEVEAWRDARDNDIICIAGSDWYGATTAQDELDFKLAVKDVVAATDASGALTRHTGVGT